MIKMKKLYKHISITLIAACMVACDISDFDDINVNPNATNEPNAAILLTNGIVFSNNVDFNIASTVYATQGQLYVQYLANSQYTSADTYQNVQFSYNTFYNGPLTDLQKVIELNTDEETKVFADDYGSHANQIAVAKILQAYYFLHITDRWGDIPYSEALQAEQGILTPKFDPQREVYNGIMATLKEATAMIDGGAGPTGDALFAGDMDRWEKFANTIRLVAALRLSEVDEERARSEFVAAMNDGVIALDNSENIMFRHFAEQNHDNRWQDRFETRRDYTVANTLVDYMQSTANGGMMNVMMDPRLPVFADPTESTGGFVGMVYGVNEAEAGDISNSDVSFLGNALRVQDAPTYIYTSAQVLFSMAEAAQRGWIAGDAEQFYNDAIKASLDQYGVGDEFDTFITNEEVAFDPARAFEQIGNQKWVALFLNGYEAWAEWRRTGYPDLVPAVAAQNKSGEIPVRQAYPVTERDLNETNYNEVVSRQGEDGLDTKVWWDVD